MDQSFQFKFYLALSLAFLSLTQRGNGQNVSAYEMVMEYVAEICDSSLSIRTFRQDTIFFSLNTTEVVFVDTIVPIKWLPISFIPLKVLETKQQHLDEVKLCIQNITSNWKSDPYKLKLNWRDKIGPHKYSTNPKYRISCSQLFKGCQCPFEWIYVFIKVKSSSTSIIQILYIENHQITPGEYIIMSD